MSSPGVISPEAGPEEPSAEISEVRIKDLASGTAAYGFDKHAGAISGGTNVNGTRTLVLDHVTVNHFQASLSDFSHVSAVNRTNTTLDSLGGPLTLTIKSGSALTLTGTSGLTSLALGGKRSPGASGAYRRQSHRGYYRNRQLHAFPDGNSRQPEQRQIPEQRRPL